MKKVILFLSILTFVIISCSREEESIVNQSTNEILLKKLIVEGRTYNLTYNGSKISEVNSPYFKEIYTYESDLITKIISYDSGNLYMTKTYTYENGNLKTFIDNTERFNSMDKTVYINNSDGTVSYVKTNIQKATQEETPNLTGKLTFSNGILIKDEYISSNPSTNVTSNVYTYEYDNKNGFQKNVVGFDKLMNRENYNFNWTKATFVTNYNNNGVLSTSNQEIQYLTYEYNDNGYPKSRKYYESGLLRSTGEFFYE